jgi:hypothetical protein
LIFFNIVRLIVEFIFRERLWKATHFEAQPDDSKRMQGFGEFHDQGDAKWTVFTGQLRGHDDPGSGRPQGVFGGFSNY